MDNLYEYEEFQNINESKKISSVEGKDDELKHFAWELYNNAEHENRFKKLKIDPKVYAFKIDNKAETIEGELADIKDFIIQFANADPELTKFLNRDKANKGIILESKEATTPYDMSVGEFNKYAKQEFEKYKKHLLSKHEEVPSFEDFKEDLETEHGRNFHGKRNESNDDDTLKPGHTFVLKNSKGGGDAKIDKFEDGIYYISAKEKGAKATSPYTKELKVPKNQIGSYIVLESEEIDEAKRPLEGPYSALLDALKVADSSYKISDIKSVALSNKTFHVKMSDNYTAKLNAEDKFIYGDLEKLAEENPDLRWD